MGKQVVCSQLNYTASGLSTHMKTVLFLGRFYLYDFCHLILQLCKIQMLSRLHGLPEMDD